MNGESILSVSWPFQAMELKNDSELCLVGIQPMEIRGIGGSLCREDQSFGHVGQSQLISPL